MRFVVLSYYILKIPYSIIWKYKQLRGSLSPVVYYCGSVLDITLFEPIQKHLKPLSIVAKDKEIQRQLLEIGISSQLLPVFPKGVIMARQAAYRFPHNSIKKICFRHGAYHFKRLASTKGYNLLDAYFFSSQADLKFAQDAGITSGLAIGFPKLDKIFDGSFSDDNLNQIAQSIPLNKTKKTVLLTATWDDSGVSAIRHWFDKLDALSNQYNILVTVHPWTPKEVIETIKQTDGVFFIDSFDVLPYILLADVCVGDTSSILAECCALNKPMITFKVAEHKRSVAQVTEMIKDISWQVTSFDELCTQIPISIEHAHEHDVQRAKANKIMFDDLDGKAGKRAAEEILKYFPELAKHS